MELEKCRTPQKHGASLKTWYYIQEGPAGLQTPLNKEAGVRGLRRKESPLPPRRIMSLRRKLWRL